MLQGHQMLQQQQQQGFLGMHKNAPVRGRLQGTNFGPQPALSPEGPSRQQSCHVSGASPLHMYSAQHALQAGTLHASVAFSGQQRQHSQPYPLEEIQQQQQQQQQGQQQQHQSRSAASRYGENRGSRQNLLGARLVPASGRMAAVIPQGHSLDITSSPCYPLPQEQSCVATGAACVSPFNSGGNALEAAVALLDKGPQEGTVSPPLGARLVSRLRADSQRVTSCRSLSNSTSSSRMERQRQQSASSRAYSSGGLLAPDATDTVPSISSINGPGEERLLQYCFDEKKGPTLEAFYEGLSPDSRVPPHVENACSVNSSRSRSTRPSLPQASLSSAAGLEAPVSVSSSLFLDAEREGSAGSAALRCHSDEPSAISASRRALTASVSELQARLAAAEHQVTHNFVGCLRREILLRQLQQQLDSKAQGSTTRTDGSPLDAAAPPSEHAKMLQALQQKLQVVESERGYLKEALKRKHLFEMELRAKISSLLTLNEELQAEASTLMAFHRLTDAHGQAAAEKLLLQQASQKLALSKELQRLLANRESEVLALKREVALCRRALASFATSLRKGTVTGAIENTTTNLRPAIAPEDADEEVTFSNVPEPSKSESHGADASASTVSPVERSGTAEARPSAAPLTEASQSNPQDSSSASDAKAPSLRSPECSIERPVDDSSSNHSKAVEDGPTETVSSGPAKESSPEACGASLASPPQPPLTKLPKENLVLVAQAEASVPQADSPTVLPVGGSSMIGDAHASPKDTADALTAEPAPADVSAPGVSEVIETANAEASCRGPSQAEVTEPLEAPHTRPSSTPVGRHSQVISPVPSETSPVQLCAAAPMVVPESANMHEANDLQPHPQASTPQQSGTPADGPPAAISTGLSGPSHMLSTGSSSSDNLATISTEVPAASSLVPASLCPKDSPGLAVKEDSKMLVMSGGPSGEADVEKPLEAPPSHLVEARGTQTDSAVSWMIADLPKQPLAYPWQQTALVPRQQRIEHQQMVLLQPLEEASLTYATEQPGSEGLLMPTLGPGANPLLRFTVGPSDTYVPTADDSIDSAVALLSNTRINKVLFTRICQGVYLYGHLAVVMHLGPTGELRVSFEGKDYAVKDFIHSFEDEEFRYLAARRNQSGHTLPLGDRLECLSKPRAQQQPRQLQQQQQQPQQQQHQQQPRSPSEPACEGTMQKSVAQANASKEERPAGGTVALPADLTTAARVLAALAGARRRRTPKGAAATPATAAPVKKSKSSAAAVSSLGSSNGTLPPGKSKGNAGKQRLRASAAAVAAAADQPSSLRKASHAGGTKRRATSAKSRLS
ncbi:hypothetical protein Emed_000710 [Eimeria media]